MKTNEILEKLIELGNDKRRATYIKNGANEKSLGVGQGDIRKLSKTLKLDHKEIMNLWNSDISDAQFLSVMLMNHKDLSKEDINRMINEVDFVEVIDKFVKEVVRFHKDKEELLEEWIRSDKDLIKRSGWYLMVYNIQDGKYSSEELDEILEVIKENLVNSLDKTQWAMNHALCEIGIRNTEYTNTCLQIGENLGVYKDMKVSKGCTSPYAPSWINAVVSKRK